ncbi:MAG: hypothetical protein C4295_10135 [Candidatus Fervidibacterota bacterium]
MEVIANKVRGETEKGLIVEYCGRHGLPLRLVVPWDEHAYRAEQTGSGSVGAVPPTIAQAAGRLAEDLLSPRG